MRGRVTLSPISNRRRFRHAHGMAEQILLVTAAVFGVVVPIGLALLVLWS